MVPYASITVTTSVQKKEVLHRKQFYIIFNTINFKKNLIKMHQKKVFEIRQF
jgi:hypothetical protein